MLWRQAVGFIASVRHMRDDREAARPIVLLGGGHAHVEVLRRFAELGLGHQIRLVSPSRHAPYSGMLPGYIAGQYSFDDFHIDLAKLCAWSGAALSETTARNIDPLRRKVLLDSGEELSFEILSLDIGSTPSLPKGISAGIAVKPIASFADRLSQLDKLCAAGGPLRLAVVGQGVAGVEVAFALKQRYRQYGIEIALVGRSQEPMAERSRRARRLVAQAMHSAKIAHHAGFDVVDYRDGRLLARDGRSLAAEEVVWTTSSGAPSWLQETGLTIDAGGFIRVDRQLRSLSHPHVFAAGDIASLADQRPKAGVFAVRQGPVLAENLHRSLAGKPPVSYRPQRSWLVLISLADGRAIADKWGLALLGRWVARWKHGIDSRFMQRYRSADGLTRRSEL